MVHTGGNNDYLGNFTCPLFSLSLPLSFPLFSFLSLSSSSFLPGDAEIIENGDQNGEEDGPVENGTDTQPEKPEKPVKRIRVTYEEYKTIANLLILHLRQVEETSEEGGQ